MDRVCTILIADDDPGIVELLKVYLRALDCRVITASDGEEALEVARRELPQVALIDVQMPKRSGWEVCQELKAMQRTSRMCVVLITGRGDVKDRLTGLQLGADDYLVKPFDRNEVLTRVGRLVKSWRDSNDWSTPPDAQNAMQNLLYDRATGLPTVPVVIDKLKEVLIERSEIAVLYADVEQYEAIEVEYGWAFFDEFIRELAKRFSEELAKDYPRAILALSRAGGSSFYAFLPTDGRTTDDQLQSTVTNLREQLVRSVRQRFQNLDPSHIGFFLGLSRIRYEPQIRLERQIYHGMMHAAEAVRSAEQARRREMIREMRDIIRRRRITTLFQPIVWAVEGSIFGYEILTRGPKNSSFRNSDMLFSFARETHLAWELESIALQSCLETLRHVDLGDRKFLLNLEAEMFEVTDFKFHDMVSFFAEHKGRFVFELTERAAIQDYAVFRKLLDDFRAKGIEIAIDDAGSGYASLEAIASLAPDYLKITKGLVSTLATEPIKQDLVGMLVELAHKIGAKTIAEGIETAEEYEWCGKLGVDLLQGYHIAHPQVTVVADLADVERRM